MNIKSLVFDFGNVVGYFSHQRATDRLAPHAGVKADELHRFLFDSPLEDRYERGQVSTAEFRNETRTGCKLNCTDEFFDSAYADIFWPNAELCDLLPALARR